ncbi:MAG: ParA family protein [Clostridia bacterium]|nr:ParA family protein [Clostridia bacterium]
MSKTKVICFANNKGGSGKSTTCVNVGYEMALTGKKVLLIDGDMQMNLTLSFFDDSMTFSFVESGKTLYEGLKAEKDLAPYIVHTGYPNLDLIPSSSEMSSIEFELFPRWQREFILRKCLSHIVASGTYDFILMDAPPTLGCWVMNMLCASDELVIPVEASPWGLFGVAKMNDFVRQVQTIAPQLHVMGIAVTKADERKKYLREMLDTLHESDMPVFETIIRIDSTIEWSQDNSKPVGAYKRNSRSANEYANLAKEILNHVSR